ncbi:putative gustatory receptor 58a [Drosophila takahashii]|uniref:putative gustatory receptor 58a n=1 Tax=Drosophila takahashii TaxID=29030 RepID=UPI001CF8C700|nr:putative gustatory receptor 58a [Drosophila takahashii]
MLLKSFYIYTLGCGLVPAPLKKGKFLTGYSQKWYLLYTAFLHGVLLVLLPFTFPHYMYDESYMSSNLVLQWAFNLTNITRIMAMFSGGLMMWFKRKKLVQLGEHLRRHCLKCEKLEDNSRKFLKLRKRIRGVLGQMFFVTNLSLLVGTLILMEIDTDHGFSKIAMIATHISQYTYIVIMMAGICVILVILHWQSERVHLGLEDLCYFLNHEERNSLVLSEDKAKKSLDNLRNLFQLFAENQRLIIKVFKIFDIPIALLLLKMFVTNVNLVYHGVQFGNESIETSYHTRILGQLVVFSHYWSAVLIMNIVDDVTRSSDLKMGNCLRQFSHLELVKRDFQLQLELFSDHLRCHSATYKVCGLFVFNKQTTMVYFFFVLVQVLVLVQFDLKNKVEKTTPKYSNMS